MVARIPLHLVRAELHLCNFYRVFRAASFAGLSRSSGFGIAVSE